MKPKIILIHGNGGSTSADCWLPYVEHELARAGLEVVNRSFPDAVKARAAYWLPFIDELGADAHTVLIGHSSGAVAALRYAETHRLLGSVLVGACHTDLGEASERVSGYYGAPWDWDAIRTNQQWILQYASPTDPFIPIAEARYIQKHARTKYFELASRGHFQDNTFPELVSAVKKQLNL
ncbi:MAG TPA: alpha/beta hydrolase [Candidatus Saccharimonadia bacterium]|nr:alpha/beta hydrolase [Candidatus Saccharimonadia bacterium]